MCPLRPPRPARRQWVQSPVLASAQTLGSLSRCRRGRWRRCTVMAEKPPPVAPHRRRRRQRRRCCCQTAALHCWDGVETPAPMCPPVLPPRLLQRGRASSPSLRLPAHWLWRAALPPHDPLLSWEGSVSAAAVGRRPRLQHLPNWLPCPCGLLRSFQAAGRCLLCRRLLRCLPRVARGRHACHCTSLSLHQHAVMVRPRAKWHYCLWCVQHIRLWTCAAITRRRAALYIVAIFPIHTAGLTQRRCWRRRIKRATRMLQC